MYQIVMSFPQIELLLNEFSLSLRTLFYIELPSWSDISVRARTGFCPSKYMKLSVLSLAVGPDNRALMYTTVLKCTLSLPFIQFIFAPKF